MYGYGYKYTNGLVVSASGGAPFANTKSLLFDGLDSYLDVGKPTVFDSATNFSISTWFRTTSTANQGVYTYINPLAAASGWIELSIGSTFFRFVVDNGGITYGTASVAPALNTWYNVTVVFDGSGLANGDRLKMYINGVHDMSMIYTGAIPTVLQNMSTQAINPFKIGTRYIGADFFDGNIDEVSFFDYSLTQLQVDSVYDNGVQDLNNTVGLTAPVNYWRMGDSAGDVFPTIEDVGSAASNDGTMTSMLVTDIVNQVP